MVERAIHTLPAKAAPNRNGIRQPHASRLLVLIALTVAAEIPTASSAPSSLAAAADEVIKPRRLAGAPSSRYATTPVYSPPTEKPITQRRRKRSQPAAGPIAARVGSRPVSSIAPVISATDESIIRRRPYLSPIWPKTIAPSGRRK